MMRMLSAVALQTSYIEDKTLSVRTRRHGPHMKRRIARVLEKRPWSWQDQTPRVRKVVSASAERRSMYKFQDTSAPQCVLLTVHEKRPQFTAHTTSTFQHVYHGSSQRQENACPLGMRNWFPWSWDLYYPSYAASILAFQRTANYR